MEDLSQLWLGLRITKRMQLFHPEANIKPPQLLGSSPDVLFKSLKELVIGSVIQPRVMTDGDEAMGRRGSIRQGDLYSLLESTASCRSPDELANILRTCPATKSLVLLDGAPSPEDRCISCGDRLVARATTAAEVAGAEIALIHHLTEPSRKAVESLYQDHQKFLFYFYLKRYAFAY